MSRVSFVSPVSLAVLLLAAGFAVAQVGYDDTPFLPAGPEGHWRVHDKARPHPPVIQPGAVVGTAPSDAIVLFDGTNLDAWQKDGGDDAGWRLVDGAVEVNGTGPIRTRESFGDCQLHIEWRTPPEVKGDSQGRGNSGVFLMKRYEIQVLDSFDNISYADGQAGSIYGQRPPMVNACRGPGEWQTYDIIFRRPRFVQRAGGEAVVADRARVTVFHNGVLLHHDREFLGPTTHRQLPKYGGHGDAEPIQLQDHGNPIRYRNIWIRPLDLQH